MTERLTLSLWARAMCTIIWSLRFRVNALVTQPCPTLYDPMDCSLPDSSVHGIFQARILEWVTIPFSRGSFQPRDRTQISCIAGRFFTIWATREVLSFTYSQQIPNSAQHIINFTEKQKYVELYKWKSGKDSPGRLEVCSLSASSNGWLNSRRPREEPARSRHLLYLHGIIGPHPGRQNFI